MTTPACLVAAMFGNRKPPAASYIDKFIIEATQAVFTFTAKPIGPAAYDRFVVISLGSTIGNVTVTGVKCNGVAMAAAATGFAATNNAAAQYGLLVPSGTTADFEVTFSGSTDRCAIVIHTITGLNSTTPTHYNSATASSTVVSTTINYLDGGVIIGFACCNNDLGTTIWTNLTEDVDTNSGNNGMNWTAASKIGVGNVTGETITATHSQSNQQTLCVSSWR